MNINEQLCKLLKKFFSGSLDAFLHNNWIQATSREEVDWKWCQNEMHIQGNTKAAKRRITFIKAVNNAFAYLFF